MFLLGLYSVIQLLVGVSSQQVQYFALVLEDVDHQKCLEDKDLPACQALGFV